MFSSVLIANRGEIACRIAATCRQLGVRTVAVYSEADAGAPHVRLADRAYCIGPAPALESYLNVAALIRAVQETGADAVHPGYGFLSENASFVESLEKTGVSFIGPRPQALRTLSDKLGARKAAREAGFEPVPGSNESISVEHRVQLIHMAGSIGFPVLVKAAGGGGGIGMQLARDASELTSAIERAAGIAERTFADARVYLEKYIERPRHVEIQAFRAKNGVVGVLGSRECSIQRRYQKLIEECPSPSLGALGFERLKCLEAAACELLHRVDYVGVATIELLLGADQRPYFLEVNARLQVEHTVTEMVFGIDLVALQLKLAADEDVSSLLRLTSPKGHAIEARVYSEDPKKGFLPQPGTVEGLELPSGEGIRVDSGIENGSVVSPYYDPLLAKIIACGDSRESANQRLLQALAKTRIGVVAKNGARANNLSLLMQVLGSTEWISATYDTTLIERLAARS